MSNKPKLKIIKGFHKKFTISACMIVKNEAKDIARCLGSIEKLVDEIVIVDTGSTDGTQDLCKVYPKVKLHEPTPIMFMTEKEDGFDRIDFSANRNVAISHCTGDWIFIIDGDEYVADIGDMRLLVREADKAGVDHIIVNVKAHEELHEAVFGQVRFFKNNGRIKYTRPVHNQLRGHELEKVGAVQEFIIDSEYRKVNRDQEKEDRAEPMLRKVMTLYPGEYWPHYYLSGIYLGRKEPEKAKPLAKLVVENAPDNIETLRAWYIYIYSTLMTEGLDVAEIELYKALRVHPHFADLHMLRTVFALARWALTTEGHDPETQKYNTTAQKSRSVDFAAISAVLGIPYPFLKVRPIESEQTESEQTESEKTESEKTKSKQEKGRNNDKRQFN